MLIIVNVCYCISFLVVPYVDACTVVYAERV